MIKNADIAMYEAKGRGKNQAVFCTEDIKDSTTMNHTLVNNLYWALEKDELQLLYQSKINVDTHKIIGLEALLRCIIQITELSIQRYSFLWQNRPE